MMRYSAPRLSAIRSRYTKPPSAELKQRSSRSPFRRQHRYAEYQSEDRHGQTYSEIFAELDLDVPLARLLQYDEIGDRPQHSQIASQYADKVMEDWTWKFR